MTFSSLATYLRGYCGDHGEKVNGIRGKIHEVGVSRKAFPIPLHGKQLRTGQIFAEMRESAKIPMDTCGAAEKTPLSDPPVRNFRLTGAYSSMYHPMEEGNIPVTGFLRQPGFRPNETQP